MLRKLKAELVERNSRFIVCYADNSALEFFHKQGFRRLEPTRASLKLSRKDHLDQSFFEANCFTPQ